MESFEQFVAIALEVEGLVVSEAVKFAVPRVTRKAVHSEVQTHGYEVDLIGARRDLFVLASVKSFFGSRGVVAEQVTGTGGSRRLQDRYLLLNDELIRSAVVKAAAERYGYQTDQARLRLYVGRFAAPTTGAHERAIRSWAATQIVGGGPIEVHGLDSVIDAVRNVAMLKTYRDNPVLTTMKVPDAAGLLIGADIRSITGD